MCGIYGIINNSKTNKESEDEVLKMMKKSYYRGPDSQNITTLNHVCFGFNRLAIIDLDERSDQPFNIESIGKIIVFNGEIYNYLEIKNELLELGYSFNTNSDTEVALIAFHHYGAEAFNIFNGMWAICIYDNKNDIITLSRDRFGVKPLYYMVQEDSFYFASEIKSLIAVKSELHADPNAVIQYKVFGHNNFSDGKTFVEGIKEHPPGSYSRLKNNQLEINRYYVIPKEEKREYKKLKQELLFNFKDAIKIRMRSDVPVAILLSGGLDSSLIAYHLNELISSGELPANKVHAFTLNFKGFSNDEWDLVKKFSANLLHIICEPITIDINSFKQEIPELIKMQDIPTLSVSHLVHIIALRHIKAKGFTVVLNGQGADEVFGGYFPKDIGYLLLDLFKQSFRTGLYEINCIKKLRKISFSAQIRLMVLAYIHSKMPKYYVKLKSKDFQKEFSTIKRISLDYLNLRKSSFTSFRLKSQIFENQFNGILNYEDMASMLNSIEMRSPFLDYRIVNLGISINSSLKLHKGYSKWILREALGDVLPEEIQWANWKLGYVVPKTELLNNLLEISISQSEKSLNDIWQLFNLKKWLEHNNLK